MIFKASDWSEMFGVSARHVRRLIQQGVLPQCVGDITESQALKMVRAFMQHRTPDPAQERLLLERTRLLKLRADHAALQLKRERESLLDTKAAMAIWGAVVKNVREKAKKIPARLAPLIYGREMVEIKQALEDEVYRSLTEWANPPFSEVAAHLTEEDVRALEKARSRRK